MERQGLDERFLEFGVRVIEIVESLPSTVIGRRIGDQLLRSGTSVGANYEEAQAAESRSDFLHKLQVALKEARETSYWLRLLAKANVLPAEKLTSAIDESMQIRAILSKAVATAKKSAKHMSALLAFCL